MAISTQPKCQAWFCTTGLPTDIVIDVDHMSFHLHKFPLMSKSKKLNELITERENHKEHPLNKPDARNDDIECEADEPNEQVQCHISLQNFPGGSETFETAAKFCYGGKVDITSSNVAPLRCAGEALQMTDEYSENNLITKTETFLTQKVLKNINNSIKSLNSCEKLLPLAESLGIVERCIKTISSSSLHNPTLFGWPVNRPPASDGMQWADDLAKLSPRFFNRIISEMRENKINQEILENCVIHYANRCFPGINRVNRTPMSSYSSSIVASEAEQRELLESIIWNFPTETSSRTSSVAITFLFDLLRTANILSVSGACKCILERKIGAKLEEAILDDLLIPSYSYLNDTLYDVDCVERILEYFLKGYQNLDTVGSSAIMRVGKLIDGYLSEIASDSNLRSERFCELVVSLPEQARVYDDGVYRAIDVYLKAHPWISEEEREKISGVMNYEKLTLDACTHAAQNQRLPLRAIVQVLFFEQLQLRQAIAGTLLASEGCITDEEKEYRTATPEQEHYNTRDDSRKDNRVLRLDMDSMRTRVHELERECSTMTKFIDTISVQENEVKRSWKKGLLTRKFGCKFRIQVCDSHESSVVDSRKGKHYKK